MSRRTGQDGYSEASGKWWVVRWWMDVEGQGARKHMRAKICHISGPGHLSKSERERRAREIVAERGADTVERFNKVVSQAQGVTNPPLWGSIDGFFNLRVNNLKRSQSETVARIRLSGL